MTRTSTWMVAARLPRSSERDHPRFDDDTISRIRFFRFLRKEKLFWWLLLIKEKKKIAIRFGNILAVMRRAWKIKASVTDIVNTRCRHREKKFELIKLTPKPCRNHAYFLRLVLAANFCRPISRVSVALCRWRTLNEREADGQPVTKVTGHTSAGIFTLHTFRVSFSRAAEPPIKVANRAATSLATAARFSDSRKQITRGSKTVSWRVVAFKRVALGVDFYEITKMSQ